MAATNGDNADVVYHEGNTKAFIGGEDLGVGDMYICKSCVRWKSSFDDKVVRLQYKAIPIHAVSRDGSSFPLPCLFCMVDGKVCATSSANEATTAATTSSHRELNVVEMSDEAQAVQTSETNADNEAEEGEEGEEGEEEVSEVRFAPEEPHNLDAMYEAMSKCQMLHPDTDDEDENGGHQLGDGSDSILQSDIGSMEGFFTSPDDVVHLTEEGQRVLEHLNSITVQAAEEPTDGTNVEDGQFEDA